MSGLRIDVADLLAHPGARRTIALTETLDGLAGSAARVSGPIDLDLGLERISEGIVVRGTVTAEWQGECSSCLQEVRRRVALAVDELFEPAPVDGETYPLEGHEIDLEQLVRDTVLLELPLAPHCDEGDCAPAAVPAELAGDRDDHEPDPRWAALSELEL